MLVFPSSRELGTFPTGSEHDSQSTLHDSLCNGSSGCRAALKQGKGSSGRPLHFCRGYQYFLLPKAEAGLRELC